jgi:hypothetical protein
VSRASQWTIWNRQVFSPEHDEQRTQAGPYSVWDQIADAAVTPTDQGLLEFHHDAHRDRGSSGFDESVSVLRAKLTVRRHEEYRKPPNVPIVAQGVNRQTIGRTKDLPTD